MGKKEFDEFLTRESQVEDKFFNREEKLKRWKENVSILFNKVNNWLQEYVDTGRITVETKVINITEETIGNYDIPSLIIKLAGNIVHIKPIGTNMIGTIGRVDVIGELENRKLILADKNASKPNIQMLISANGEEKKANKKVIKTLANKPIEWEWKLATDPPNIKYSKLDKDSFLDCLLQVVNG